MFHLEWTISTNPAASGRGTEAQRPRATRPLETPIVHIVVRGGFIWCQSSDGSVTQFDTLGTQISRTSLDLEDPGPLMEFVSEDDYVEEEEYVEWFPVTYWERYIPSPQNGIILVNRIDYLQASFASEFLRPFYSMWSSLRFALGISSSLEIVAIGTGEVLGEYSFYGWSSNAIIDAKTRIVANLTGGTRHVALEIVEIGTSSRLWQEPLPRTDYHMAFQEDTLYVLGGQLLHIYAIDGDTGFSKTAVRWLDDEVDPALVFEPFGREGLGLTIVNETNSKVIGPINFVADSTLYDWCARWRGVHPYNSYQYVMFRYSGLDNRLFGFRGDTIAVIDFENDDVNAFILSKEMATTFSGGLFPLSVSMYQRFGGQLVPITVRTYAQMTQNNEIVIYVWDSSRRKTSPPAQ